jgi:ABC-type nitrate/sulfonate/bicarbonate transport system ATPase subunit
LLPVKIEVSGLSVEYPIRRSTRPLTALQDVSFQVADGKFVCVLGPSGCGKTTLLNVLAGLLVPDAGTVLLDDVPVHGPGGSRAVVFQAPSLLPWRTVIRNITYGLELQGFSTSQAVEMAGEFIGLVGLEGFEHSYPRELSGGMQQRVNLARALVTRPQLLLMDEPFAHMDPQMRDYMQSEVERIWERTQQTTLFVTHWLDEALFLADEIIVLTARPGRIKLTVPVDFPRPRRLDIKKTPRFHALNDELRDMLDQEFAAAMQERREDQLA